jgi:hypothetical protein
MKRLGSNRTIIWFPLLPLFVAFPNSAFAARRPNSLFILVDD